MCFFSYINLTDSSGNCSFAELSKVLEPGKAAKTDKSSIITDAIRIVTQLRAENGQLRQLNKFLEVPALLLTHRSHTACNHLQPALVSRGKQPSA